MLDPTGTVYSTRDRYGLAVFVGICTHGSYEDDTRRIIILSSAGELCRFDKGSPLYNGLQTAHYPGYAVP